MKGLLLINLGTPDAPERGAVYRYLKQFLLDPRVIDIPWLPRNLLVRGIIAPFRSGKSALLYQKLWTNEGSPLKVYGQKLVSGVQNLLGGDFAVELAMRYQQPSIQAAIDKLMARQVREIIVFPLFPQYASATTGSVHEEVMRVLSEKQTIPSVRFINSYYDYEPMIDVFASNARKYNPDAYDHILFSYHGLPQRQLLKADAFNHCLQSADCCQTIQSKNQFCYTAQCHATSFNIAARLGLSRERFTVCFQSRLGRNPWAQPYTASVIEERATKGDKRLLVFSPAFVSDCLETTVEIGMEYKEMFTQLGGETLDLVESLNDHPDWVRGVANYVLQLGD